MTKYIWIFMSRKGKAGRKKDEAAPDHLGPLVMGRNAVSEVLNNCPGRIKYALVSDNISSSSTRARELACRLQANNIPIEGVSAEELSALVGSAAHQSFVAVLRKRILEDLDAFLVRKAEDQQSLILLLDEITDPQNFGAILRASECMGVDAVIWSRNRGVGISPAVSKVSVGASELLTLIEVGNLVESAKKIKKQGYWIVAADARQDNENISEFSFPEKTALLIGSEQKGIRKLLLSNADLKVRIPLFGKIDSLNVSQATAILLYAYRLKFNTRGSS